MTNPFYSSEQSDLSRAVLGEVLAGVPTAILIGGWGSWVRTGGPISHDVDLIVTRGDMAALGSMVDDLSQSHHLAGTQWRATWRSIHLDLYVPFQSRLGANLQLQVEKLTGYAETVDGHRVLTVPAHTATKIAALLDRPDSLPGRKDRYEILRLLDDPAASQTPAVILGASARTVPQVDHLLHQAFVFLAGEASLTKKQRAELRSTETAWRRTVPRPPGIAFAPPNTEPGIGL